MIATPQPMQQRIEAITRHVKSHPLYTRQGRLHSIAGPTMTVGLSGVGVGDLCEVDHKSGTPILAEVTAVARSNAILTPLTSTAGLRVGALVRASERALSVSVSEALLGRVVDAFGAHIDTGAPLPSAEHHRLIKAQAPSAMTRPLVDTPLLTGVNAIDGCLTLAHGQRVALFGPPGTGKSTLLAAIAQGAAADVIVIALVGERGREVREFIDRDLDAAARKKTVIVAATSDRTAIERALCAQTATTIAEYFRDKGKSVLLMVDSLTRTARALREIGLSSGEAPTRRGYPASVYPALPALIERSGRADKGDITALYTVLVENGGQGDPIAEEVRSLTDGHIVLSQKLAETGHFPAIDVLESLSRIMPAITNDAHQTAARRLRQMLAKFAEVELLVQIGEYEQGSDPQADAAIATMPAIRHYLTTVQGKGVTLPMVINALRRVTQ